MTELAFAGYHSFTRIGRGGLGDVFRAVQTSTGAPVAVKVLRDVSDSSTAWHRTRRELTALQTLRGHPNVIESIELVERAEGPALVMEYAAGGSLADLLQSREAAGSTSLAVAETLFVARQTATALLAAHERGIVHRDIKPQNLLIGGAGQIKLCDFGIAALTHDERYRTRTNAISMRYASPEDLESDQPVGPPSDIYSLGATMLHLAHGAPPTLRDRLSPWIPPDTDDVGLAALDRIIATCLHPSPLMRPTAAQLLDDLDALARVIGTGVDALPVGRTDDASEPAGVEGERTGPDAPLIRFDDATPLPSETTTVVRSGRAHRPEVPAIVARPKIEPRSPRLVAVTCAVVGALVVGTALTVWLTRHDTAGAGGPLQAERPTELAALVDADWSAGVVGDCLVQVPEHDALEVVDCAAPHDLQRFARGELTGTADDYDAETVAAFVDAQCDTAFASFVGTTTDETRLEIAETRPTEQTWRSGDRTFQCYLGLPDARIIGPAQATQR